jgi:DNA ligase (NAD+)
MSEVKLNKEQLSVIKKLDNSIESSSFEEFISSSINELSLDNLLVVLKLSNALYRSGIPVLNDEAYDAYITELESKVPNHSYLTTIEPEVLIDSKTVPLPKKMLSTDKAYSFSEIKKWTDRLVKAGAEIGLTSDDIVLKVTPKLDGYAAYDDGTKLYTRGDGTRGQDITRVFDRGLKVGKDAGRGLGPGEIVINKSYFNEELNEQFENSRNIQAAIIAEKNVDKKVQKAIDDGACVFYPFSVLEKWTGNIEELLTDFEIILERMWNVVDFDIDGLILETTNEPIKEHMGATRKFHRWQIAFKVNEDSAEVEVINIIPQTSRTGRISPVAELVPTKLSGAMISRVTVHHYNMVKSKRIGPGAIVQLVRSGLVIPKIEKVIKESTSESSYIPSVCPSCETHLIWESDHLICPNKTDCSAQTENTLVHFFKTLGNNDGFGPKVIAKLHESGMKRIHEIYEGIEHKFLGYGFGEKTANNLVDQLRGSQLVEIEDWRFLAAFGVSRLAGGNCEKLLQHHSIVELFDVSADEMVKIDGFAKQSAEAIVEGLANVKEEFFKVYELGFNLSITPKQSEQAENDSPIAGKLVVFTGSMARGARGDMEKQAKLLGAKVGKSVSGKTDLLITGDKVGENKINAARDKGIKVISELDYLDLIKV